MRYNLSTISNLNTFGPLMMHASDLIIRCAERTICSYNLSRYIAASWRPPVHWKSGLPTKPLDQASFSTYFKYCHRQILSLSMVLHKANVSKSSESGKILNFVIAAKKYCLLLLCNACYIYGNTNPQYVSCN